MLSLETQAEILSLHFCQKIGLRAISRKLGINRKSVRLVVERRGVSLKPAPYQRDSVIGPFKEQILCLLKDDPQIPATVIHQRIRERVYLGSYSVVKRWVSAQRQVPVRSRQAFLQLNFAPGECAQVDWGEFGNVFGDGVKVHCFLMVLCYSRLLYVEFTRSEKFEEFIRCHENAFKYFGERVPLECWYDNLATAVTERMGSLVRFNARFLAYMGHHGVRPHACNVARGNEKGRVEDGVKYVRTSFWPGRKFKDFSDLRQQSEEWLGNVANTREHRSTRKIPSLHFKSDEQSKMRLMNLHPYDTDEVFSRVVPPNFHIVYETNKYSVPWTLVGMTVTLRVNSWELKIFYHDSFVTAHQRCYEKHKTFSRSDHQKGLLERKPGSRRDDWQLHAVKSLGLVMAEYIKLLRSGQRSLRSEMAKMLALATVYGDQHVYNACKELLSTGVVGVENLELLLKNTHHPKGSQLCPQPLSFQNQKLNRVVPTVDLRGYDSLLFESTKNGEPMSQTGDQDESKPRG